MLSFIVPYVQCSHVPVTIDPLYCSVFHLQGNHVVLANAKLALFYDWLAYNPEVDNIMNIGNVIARLKIVW